MIGDLAEARNWHPEQVLDLTLPQLAAVCKDRKQRESEGVVTNPTDEFLAANLSRNRGRDDRIVRQIEAGYIR